MSRPSKQLTSFDITQSPLYLAASADTGGDDPAAYSEIRLLPNEEQLTCIELTPAASTNTGGDDSAYSEIRLEACIELTPVTSTGMKNSMAEAN